MDYEEIDNKNLSAEESAVDHFISCFVHNMHILDVKFNTEVLAILKKTSFQIARK